jgi:hypothetical protein
LPKKLNPEHSVLLLIDDVKNDEIITIINATYKDDQSLIDLYAKKMMDKVLFDLDSIYRFQEGDWVRETVEKELYKKIVSSLVNGTHEFKELIKRG